MKRWCARIPLAAVLVTGCGQTTLPPAPGSRTDGGSRGNATSFVVLPRVWERKQSVASFDLTAVWGSGREVWAVGRSEALLHSVDDGRTFELVGAGLDPADAPELTHVTGTGADDVWIAGHTRGGQYFLLHSGDHGASWQRQSVASQGTPVPTVAVWAYDPSRVNAFGKEGTIMQSHDGGVTWYLSRWSVATELTGVWGGKKGLAYAAGYRAADDPDAAGDLLLDGGRAIAIVGVLLHTRDYGLSWDEVPLGSPAALRAVWGTPDGRTVFVSGSGASVAWTVDGGATWDTRGSPFPGADQDLTSVWVAPETHRPLFASGAGVIGRIEWDLMGSVSIVYDSPTLDGTRARPVALWGTDEANVWGVGPAGAIWHRTER